MAPFPKIMTPTNQTPITTAASQPETFINKVEVAQRLGKTLRTVDNWMGRGILPYYKIGRSVSFRWTEIDAHLAATCRVGSLRTATRGSDLK